MRSATMGCALLCACAAVSEDGERVRADGPAPLTLERIFDEPSLTGTAPSAPTWSPDGRLLAFLWNDAGAPERELWVVGADGDGLRQVTGDATRAVGADQDFVGVSQAVWLPGSDALVFLRGGDLWRTDLEGRATRWTRDGAGRGHLDVSPDGRHVSFLQDGDLWIATTSDGQRRRLTEVGVRSLSEVTLGRYRRREVEVGTYVWGGPSTAWAPDGRTIAVHHVDRRHLRRVPFPHYLGEETDPNFVRRGYPGDPNEARRVGLVSVENGGLALLDLPDPTEVRVVDFAWSPDGRLLIDREADTAVDRWLHVFEPATGALQQLWHDRRETRIYNSIGSAWHPDGRNVLLWSDLEDRYGLFVVGPDHRAPLRVTPDAYDVTAGPQVRTAGERAAVFYQGNQPNPYERQVFRWTPDGAIAPVTQRPGRHDAFPSPDGSRVALLSSSDAEPTDLWLTAGDGSGEARRITSSPPPEFHERDWARARYFTFPSRIDDYTLHARILEPARLEPDKRYPVLFGPMYSNTVRNAWSGRWALIQQLLVERGYLVVQVDVRGSTGYGRAFREEFLLDFAGEDLDDVESAVAAVSALPHVDPERLGIWGSSYGGTLTLYSLLRKAGLFRAGVACATAVDPYFFGSDDVAIVRRPDTHPAAFERGARQYAGDLEDHLLLIHGMQDQVVPFKTVVELAEELMLQGKDFDFAFAPGATHSWAREPHHARYLFGKLLQHFDRYLAEEPPTD